MSDVQPARIGLVMGDPCGISPELMARLLAMPETAQQAAILVIGDRRVLAEGEKVARVSLKLPIVKKAEDATLAVGQPVFLDLGHLDPAAITLQKASAEGGGFAMTNFKHGLALAKRGLVDALCFTPFNKTALRLAGNPYEDELQLAADVLEHKGTYGEFNVLEKIWNARCTSHVPLNKVSSLITVDRIIDALRLTHNAMQAAGFARPRIAVAALNPHAGDGGNFGREEIDVITPAVEKAKQMQFAVEGPYPSDTVYLRARDGKFDAVLSMYHDQGQIAIKLMGFDKGVTVLGGLPIPICTPAHGTAYEIAGQGVANPEATRQAFRIACRMGSARRAKAA